MALSTSEQTQIVRKINRQVRKRIMEGGNEMLLTNMEDLMLEFHRLMQSASEQQMQDFSTRYPYFFHFAKVLECLAEGIECGDIPVPKVH